MQIKIRWKILTINKDSNTIWQSKNSVHVQSALILNSYEVIYVTQSYSIFFIDLYLINKCAHKRLVKIRYK